MQYEIRSEGNRTQTESRKDYWWYLTTTEYLKKKKDFYHIDKKEGYFNQRWQERTKRHALIATIIIYRATVVCHLFFENL